MEHVERAAATDPVGGVGRTAPAQRVTTLAVHSLISAIVAAGLLGAATFAFNGGALAPSTIFIVFLLLLLSAGAILTSLVTGVSAFIRIRRHAHLRGTALTIASLVIAVLMVGLGAYLYPWLFFGGA
ncbi:hypothetical protein ASF63_06775 [Microbacterium sp. Leaf320]|nr:hypothetical protein ASF63_06775 [Microbacterium sp. Leaf320]